MLDQSKYSHLKLFKPNISIDVDFANRVVIDIERYLNENGFDLSVIFHDYELIRDCEHQAWMEWLKYRESFVTVSYLLNSHNSEERISNNIKRNRLVMDTFFYQKLIDKSNSKRRRYIMRYQKHEDQCRSHLINCHEFLVVAFCAANEIRRLGDIESKRFSELSSIVTQVSPHHVGMRLVPHR